MEVMYDLDVEAAAEARSLGLRCVRARTVGVDPAFIEMLCELIEERAGGQRERRALGALGPSHDVCPLDCCLDGRPAGLTAREPIRASR
jgi:ferrochelatase